jgi:hypothetical protein
MKGVKEASLDRKRIRDEIVSIETGESKINTAGRDGQTRAWNIKWT